jgi:CRISPR-associated endoribonuclease Cas6
MRLNLRLTGNTEPVPFDHLHRLTGALHKWLGTDNPEHDGLSLYSFGWLTGGKPEGRAMLTFARGAGWFVGFHDADAARRVLDGILRDPEVTHGMRVFEVQEQPVPHFSGCYRFKVAGPVVARTHREGGGRDYLLWDDPRAADALTRVLRHKLEVAGFGGEHLDARVQFDGAYPGARTKLVTIKGISHKASLCPVVVTGTPEAVRFAWEVGVGELTGSGCGALW